MSLPWPFTGLVRARRFAGGADGAREPLEAKVVAGQCPCAATTGAKLVGFRQRQPGENRRRSRDRAHGTKNEAKEIEASGFRLQAFPPKLRRALPVEAGWVAVGERHVPAGARWAGLAESHSTLHVLASDELGRASLQARLRLLRLPRRGSRA